MAVRASSMARLSVVLALALAATPGRADDPACIPGAEVWQPPVELLKDKVPAGEALARVEEQRHYLWEQQLRQRAYWTSRQAEAMQTSGLTEIEQAVMLGGANWAQGNWVGAGPNWESSLRFQGFAVTLGLISDDFYQKNVQPLIASENWLRSDDAPAEIPAGDLDYMDDRMHRLVTFEPVLRRLSDRMHELLARQAVLVTDALMVAEEGAALGVFDRQWTAPTAAGVEEDIKSCEYSEGQRRFRETWEKGRERLLSIDPLLDELTTEKEALLAEYRAMEIQFTVEIGKRSDVPDCAREAKVDVVPYPAEGIAD